MTYFHWFHILTSGGHWYLEVTTSRIIWGNKGVSEWNRNTKKPVIWYLTWLIFIDFVFWHPEVIDISRSHPAGPSEVIKGSQNGIGTPENLWFDTSHDPFLLISYFDLQRSLISGGQDLHVHLRLNKGLRMESEHQKTCDLIPHMTYFHWFHILTSGGHWYLEVTTSRIIWG